MPATDPEQMEHLRNLLRTNGWRQVMRPIIEERARVIKDLALELPAGRPKPYSELSDAEALSLLRGEYKGLMWVANVFEQTVATDDANRRRDELARLGVNHEPEAANPL